MKYSDVDDAKYFGSTLTAEVNDFEAVGHSVVKYFVNFMMVSELSQAAMQKCILLVMTIKRERKRYEEGAKIDW